MHPRTRFGHTARLMIALALVCLGHRQGVAQPSEMRLTSGQTLTLHGTLRLAHRGFFSYVLLDTGKTYIADGGKDEGTKKVALIEIESYGNQALLLKHIGAEVTAQGELFVEFAAPVPYNGVMLEHATVTLPDGTLVKPEPQETKHTPPPLPPGLQRYMVIRTMVPNSRGGGTDTAVDLTTGRLLPEGNPDFCILSGAQDFMTCGCANGFVPVRGGLVERPFPPDQWKSVPLPQQIWKEMRAAQFAIPEGVRGTLHIQLVCERRRAK